MKINAEEESSSKVYYLPSHAEYASVLERKGLELSTKPDRDTQRDLQRGRYASSRKWGKGQRQERDAEMAAAPAGGAMISGCEDAAVVADAATTTQDISLQVMEVMVNIEYILAHH